VVSLDGTANRQAHQARPPVRIGATFTMREILKSLTEALADGRERLMCQVVETKGSTPQKAGAVMVVDPDGGGQVGTLGGGCVENEVKMKAIRRVGQPGAEAHTFILDHDYAWADGLICGGKMVIVAEAVRGTGPLAYFDAFRKLLDAGEGFTEAVVIDPAKAGGGEVGARFLFDAAGELAAAWPSAEVPPGVHDRIKPLAGRPIPSTRDGVAAMPSLPRVRLVIVGAGHVGQAVAELAARADFDVWIVDDRAQYANAARFPEAGRIVVGPFAETLPALDLTPQTYALIVTRGHGHDQEALFHLAPTAASYVGLIGSRRKIRLIFDELREQGIAAETLARVSAPVGIAIGSQTVVEIAISIVAELIARRNLGVGDGRVTVVNAGNPAS
jgi:xanthine dehydrogenase accessory factor